MDLIHTVAPEEAGITLQQLLRGPLGLSARQARLIKKEGAVTVDAAPFFSNQRLSAGMIVRVTLPAFPHTREPAPAPNTPPLRIIYEDEALLAVCKPPLLQCHPSPSAPGGSDTLESRVYAYLGVPAHPVHRLDTETTGLVLFARMAYAQAHLQRQMQEGCFAKTYHAWVYGIPIPPAGKIDAPIARLSPDSFTRIVRPDGQAAVSRYRTLCSTPLPGGSASLLELSPLTGRTHQLRVHMAHIGYPLLGDTRYFTEASQAASRALGLGYHQLSAVGLCFTHPLTGAPISLHCPADFAFHPGSWE